MSQKIYLNKQDQELMPLFNGAFVENKPIPFPNSQGTTAYSNLFYWAHLEAKETAEFPLHPHEGFEIVTFIFKGSLEHFDTATKVWTPLQEGGIQVIQAGSGVKHAERIIKGTELFQIWFDPDFSKSLKTDAAYTDYLSESFKIEKEEGLTRLIYMDERSDIHFTTKGLEITKTRYEEGNFIHTLDKDYIYSYYLLGGKMELDNKVLDKDDFIVLEDVNEVELKVSKKAELFLIKSPAKIDYNRFIQRY